MSSQMGKCSDPLVSSSLKWGLKALTSQRSHKDTQRCCLQDPSHRTQEGVRKMALMLGPALALPAPFQLWESQCLQSSARPQALSWEWTWNSCRGAPLSLSTESSGRETQGNSGNYSKVNTGWRSTEQEFGTRSTECLRNDLIWELRRISKTREIL